MKKLMIIFCILSYTGILKSSDNQGGQRYTQQQQPVAQPPAYRQQQFVLQQQFARQLYGQQFNAVPPSYGYQQPPCGQHDNVGVHAQRQQIAGRVFARQQTSGNLIPQTQTQQLGAAPVRQDTLSKVPDEKPLEEDRKKEPSIMGSLALTRSFNKEEEAYFEEIKKYLKTGQGEISSAHRTNIDYLRGIKLFQSNDDKLDERIKVMNLVVRKVWGDDTFERLFPSIKK